MVSFEHPEMFWLILPVLIGGIYLLRKATKKGLIISRIIVVALLIIALASPYTLSPRVTVDDNPNIVLISDETESMNIFDKQAATNLYESLAAKTPTTLVRLTGDKTALGDAIMQYSTGDNQLVMITDGNSNSGADLEEALKFAQDIGTTVYYVQPDLTSNDITAQITGDKTVIVNNVNQFDMIISQAGTGEISYRYELYINDQLARSANVVQEGRQKNITLHDIKFSKLGKHTMKLVIIPSGGDSDNINNDFYKSVYAIPKPKITAIGLETGSPLAYSLQNLYAVSTATDLSSIDGKKAIVIDNTHANSFSQSDVTKLKAFLNDGHGIVVVGGDHSYNYGNYLDSPIEEILPVVSRPTDWSGGRNVVLVLDVSGSSVDYNMTTDIVSNAVKIIKNENLRDSHVGIITFGSKGFDFSNGLLYLGTSSNIELLEQQLEEMKFGGGETNLNEGLEVAETWLEDETGELEIIIISDGAIDSYKETIAISQRLHAKGVNFYFLHINSGDKGQDGLLDENGNYVSKRIMEEVNGSHVWLEKGERANIIFSGIQQPSDQNDTAFGSFPLIELNTQHFITRNVEVEGEITGYNDVTPKAGADRLVITATGKPVLTTWRYGLGRVAAITTDNGERGGNRWGTALYSGNNSKIVSSTVNWAIGNPREETGAVVEAPDTWYGTPADVVLTMYDTGIPILKLNGDNVDLSLTGNNVYEASISPDTIGVHDLSGYPLAVNYALEYRDVGLNENLPSLIRAYGGNTYTEDEARASLLTEARQKSQKLVRDIVSHKMYFLLAALIIFLGEVIVRRIREIREMKKMQSEMQG
ncbi:VWA domain-containing protein [Methanolobus sp.]|uniref:VWA domain-containing protein n=1 Tax=Methanolobus sp. TaxID=1874737 RepID=UPI0025FC7148|nr:VWA domain-containing protein [Methanolobus sp.]